jgi:hypothetical protein
LTLRWRWPDMKSSRTTPPFGVKYPVCKKFEPGIKVWLAVSANCGKR